MGVSGILNVNKPAGCTSFSIITRLRRLTGIKRIGHAGTLDPLASGVLPVCLGQATRVIEFIQGGVKKYFCVIELGATTDTYDAEGKVLERGSFSHITSAYIGQALAGFRGDIEQTPPSFSAIKIRGRPYYELARSGQPLKPPPRKVHISSLELTGFDLPYIQLTVQCSKGTYMRSLAHDLGQLMGCGAYLKDLVRSACGPFTLDTALPVEAIETATADNRLEEILCRLDYPLINWPQVVLTDELVRAVISGCDISLSVVADNDIAYCRAYDPAGNFLAILKSVRGAGLWHPDTVFA